MLHTTFARAKEAGACIESYKKFAQHKGEITKWGRDNPFGLDEVLEVCGLDDALWCLPIVIEPADKGLRLFACDCAERVLHVYEKEYPNDKRPRQAIEVTRKFSLGQATSEEMAAARAAAWDAARDAAGDVAGDAAGDAAWAAARAAAGATAWAAARAAAGAAARAAARDAAGDVAWDAAWAAAGDAEEAWQKEKLLEMLQSH